MVTQRTYDYGRLDGHAAYIAPRYMRGVAQPNNSLNPTRRSLPFMNVVALRLPCVVASAVGLIRALCFC
jgi:hypothetical protein